MDSFAALRGIYSADKEQLETFQHGVPTFDTIEECMAWVQQHARFGSNPDEPRLRHMFTHLFNWKQVQEHVLPQLAAMRPEQFNAAGEDFYYNNLPPSADGGAGSGDDAKSQDGSDAEEAGPGTAKPAPSTPPRQNRAVSSFEFKPVREYLESRLALKFHRAINTESTCHTLHYLFNHMRCGILVVIRRNQVALFAPFVNRDYENNWGQSLRTDPADFDEYFKLKRKFYRKENIIPDKTKWWANGNIICNEHHTPREPFTHYWSDNLLAPFKHMLETLCRERRIPDVELFFNKRDHPQLKADLTEPYDFVFDKKDVPLERERYASYAPIMSFYTSPRFADLPVPTTEDWESAVGRVFPPSFIPDTRTNKISEPRDLYLKANFEKFRVDWGSKTNTAFFRGNATGGGTTPETNQRLKLAKMCQEWTQDGSNGAIPLLDAGVTGFNVRDKKRFGEPMRFTQNSKIGIEKAQRFEMYRQGSFKYILYVEGHCAANRYSFLMRLGSVIFKVESTCEASEMWFFPLLNPYVPGSEVVRGVNGADHISIKADLSDLREKIEWCRANDEKCELIAENARSKYQRCLSKESILDYMQMLLVKTAKAFEHPPSWWTPPEPLNDKPHLAPMHKKCTRDQATGAFVYCARCERDRTSSGSKRRASTGAGAPTPTSKKHRRV